MSEEPAIIVKDVYKSFKLPNERYSGLKQLIVNFYRRKPGYQKQEVLKDISFDIKKGEFFGILGRNGSGKSTLLKLLAGIYTPDSGDVHLSGSLTPFIELGVGFNPELTGRENIFLNGSLLGFSHKEMEAMYADIVEFAELERFMDQKLKNYSSGMQVRLAFSIAIRAQSDILLIDEVLAVGDALFQQKCFETFKEIKYQGKTVVFISHDLAAVEAFCDRGAIIDGGQLRAVGKTEDIISEYRSLLAQEEAKQEVKKNKKGGTHIVQTDQVHITSAELLDHQGNKVKSLKEGEGFTVRVHYKAKEVIEKPVIGIGIMDMDGNSILGPNTRETDFSATLTPGNGYFEATFDTGILPSDIYSLRAAIFDERGIIPYDFTENLLSFRIMGKNRYGKALLHPSWRVTNTAQASKVK